MAGFTDNLEFMNLTEHTAKWLVGNQLACVLHVGDRSLAYQLAEQGHEVTVVDPLTDKARHSDISYVRGSDARLPFTAEVFDVVVAEELNEPQSTLAEFARVLRKDGLLSTLTQTYDDSIPWLRKLYEIIGRPAPKPAAANTLGASGLFHPPETRDAGSWQELDLDGLIQFARASMSPENAEASLHEVRRLWDSYGTRTGSLRLRQQTTCLRARVDKAGLPEQPEPADVKLFDFS